MVFAPRKGGRLRSVIRVLATTLTLVVLVGSTRILGDDCRVDLVSSSELTAIPIAADHSSSGDSCACFCDCGCAGVLLTVVSSSVQGTLVEAPAPTGMTARIDFHHSIHPSPPTRPPRA